MLRERAAVSGDDSITRLTRKAHGNVGGMTWTSLGGDEETECFEAVSEDSECLAAASSTVGAVDAM